MPASSNLHVLADSDGLTRYTGFEGLGIAARVIFWSLDMVSLTGALCQTTLGFHSS